MYIFNFIMLTCFGYCIWNFLIKVLKNIYKSIESIIVKSLFPKSYLNKSLQNLLHIIIVNFASNANDISH